MKILIINGPNLNLLGKRETEIYGTETFESYFRFLKESFADIDLMYFQSNHEGEIIDKIHEYGFSIDYILINAGGLTHTSVSIADAIAGINTPVVEVHISNPYSREMFRRTSYLSPNCKAVITGFGLNSYYLALEGCIMWKEASN